MTDRQKIGRNSKARGKAYEREVAKILGGRRFPADSGGPVDVDHPWLWIQVKSTKQPAAALRDGLAEARATCPDTKLATVVVIDRTGPRPKRYICFDLQEFAVWHGEGREDG